MEKIAELEVISKRYGDLKHNDNVNSELEKISTSIVETLCSPSFMFPLETGGIVSEGTTSFFYTNNIAFPNLFEFLSELLHVEIPIKINKTKFGPGEILIGIGNEKDARQEMISSTEELKKLVRAKKRIE
ncbi:MAG TPA: hypothetical protein VH500_19705 [Nitrososphaeraceae archaeon]|jgi:hypothetical protein